MAVLDKNVIFRPYFELEAKARQSVEALCEVICAYFGNIGRNIGYFILPIFSQIELHHCSGGKVGNACQSFKLFSNVMPNMVMLSITSHLTQLPPLRLVPGFSKLC